MANGFDCKEHKEVLERLKFLEKVDARKEEQIKQLSKENDEMGSKMDDLMKEVSQIREQMAKLPMIIIFATVSLTSAITAIIVKLM